MPLVCLPLSTLGGKVKTIHSEERYVDDSGLVYDQLQFESWLHCRLDGGLWASGFLSLYCSHVCEREVPQK